MMGLRGCRLGLTRPALNQMQVRAIFEAACDAAKEGVKVFPEIMIPITSHVNELKTIQPLLEKEAESVMEEKGIRVPYKFGTMIEIPARLSPPTKSPKSPSFSVSEPMI